MWISQGLNEADYDHKIIKSLGISTLNPRSFNTSIIPVRDKEREEYTLKLKIFTDIPFTEQLLELFDLGMTDLDANILAIQ